MLCYYIILIYIDIYHQRSSGLCTCNSFSGQHMQYLCHQEKVTILVPSLDFWYQTIQHPFFQNKDRQTQICFILSPSRLESPASTCPLLHISIKSCLRTHLFKSRMKSMLFFVLFFNVVHKIVAACGPVSCIWFWTVWTSSERVMWSRCGCGLPKDVFDGVTASVIMLSGG